MLAANKSSLNQGGHINDHEKEELYVDRTKTRMRVYWEDSDF